MFLRVFSPVRQFLFVRNGFNILQAASYKSQYSLDNIYPNCTAELESPEVRIQNTLKSKKAFSGYIPIEDVTISYSPSSSRILERVNSKVKITFHVQSAKWISDTVKAKLHEEEAARITKDGYLVVSSEKTCHQILNQADCMDQLRRLIFNSAADRQSKNKQLTKGKPTNVLRVKKSSLTTV